MTTFGNAEILNLNKTAFLCSRKIPARVVLKCYDWAIDQREKGNCIISGFHSQLEKDVLHYLLKGRQPLIVVLARGMKEKIEPEFINPLEQGRLLIITPFEEKITRVTQRTAFIRNRFMIEIADDIAIGHVSVGGQLDELLKDVTKQMVYL
ncbi:MAG: DNA-binding protein [Bacteroidetes bacterium]|nr:DNA-binding protein [Bacteroidota bacterium]